MLVVALHQCTLILCQDFKEIKVSDLLPAATGVALCWPDAIQSPAFLIPSFRALPFIYDFSPPAAQKRRILSAAASAGVAVAFGSPLGGVLFGLEELDLFSRAHVMWRAFVCAVLAAVTLQWTDVFATGKLV